MSGPAAPQARTCSGPCRCRTGACDVSRQPERPFCVDHCSNFTHSHIPPSLVQEEDAVGHQYEEEEVGEEMPEMKRLSSHQGKNVNERAERIQKERGNHEQKGFVQHSALEERTQPESVDSHGHREDSTQHLGVYIPEFNQSRKPTGFDGDGRYKSISAKCKDSHTVDRYTVHYKLRAGATQGLKIDTNA